MFVFDAVTYKTVLDIPHFIIHAHQITFVVGESGSGKTTLLRLLNKMLSPDSGEIYFNGEPLHTVDSVRLRRSVVMLPQSAVIFEGTVRENLLMGLEFAQKPPVKDSALAEMMERLRLDKPLNQNADKLSGGEKQRIALGRVLLMSPEVLLLDEPSSSLDEETELLIFDMLTDYTKSHNKTLICVTHSKKAAAGRADRMIELKNHHVREAAL